MHSSSPSHRVETWVFDLDHTLYPADSRLFSQIETRMADFIQRLLGCDRAHAHTLRARYWAQHGTTLAGLIADHSVDPMAFLEYVHNIDMSVLAPDPALAKALGALDGRKIIFTNGDTDYAARVLRALGVEGCFEALYGIEHTKFVPKPAAAAFDAIVDRDRFSPARAVMFEDTVRNLEVPHHLGMGCVLVGPGPADPAPHVHHHTRDLAAFLSQIEGGALPGA